MIPPDEIDPTRLLFYCFDCEADHEILSRFVTIDLPAPGEEPGITLRTVCPNGHPKVRLLPLSTHPDLVRYIAGNPHMRVDPISSGLDAVELLDRFGLWINDPFAFPMALADWTAPRRPAGGAA